MPAGRRLLLGGSLHHELVLIAAGRGLVRCAGETLAELGPGDAFGELSTRRPAYVTATVFAATALHLVVFAHPRAAAVREQYPDAVEALIAACSLDPAERATALAGPRPVPELRLVSAPPPPRSRRTPRRRREAAAGTREPMVASRDERVAAAAGGEIPRAAHAPGVAPRASCTRACRTPSRASRFCRAPCSPRRFTSAGPERRLALRLRALREPDVVGLRAGARRARGRRGRAVLIRHGGGRRGAHGWPRRGRRRRRAGRLLPRRAHDRDRAAAPARRSRCGSSRRTRKASARRSTGATLVWVETPSNPGLDILDVAALATDAHAAGALLAVDNTLARPLTQRPLELGADLSVSSASKLLCGHSDLVLGYVAVRDPARARSCGPGAASPARSPVRWRPGSPIARWRRSTCAMSASAPAPCCSRRRSRRATTCSASAIPGSPATPRTRLPPRASVGASAASSASTSRRGSARRRFSMLASSSPRRRASAACTARPSAGCGGASTRCRRVHPLQYRHRGCRGPRRRRPRGSRRLALARGGRVVAHRQPLARARLEHEAEAVRGDELADRLDIERPVALEHERRRAVGVDGQLVEREDRRRHRQMARVGRPHPRLGPVADEHDAVLPAEVLLDALQVIVRGFHAARDPA